MARHLLIRLEAPLVAFGGEMIDEYGVIRNFPALSMVAGLLANALGWRREQRDLHDHLQNRLIIGARLDSESRRLTDFQTAQLSAKDKGWTTWGDPEERRGGQDTYKSPHLRYRDYHADLSTLVALRLEPAVETPTLKDLAHALDYPARPLFIGRKPCLPNRRLFAGWQEGDHVLQVLQTAPLPEEVVGGLLMQWPDGEGQMKGDRVIDLCDERNWRSGVHGGWRPIREGTFHPNHLEGIST